MCSCQYVGDALNIQFLAQRRVCVTILSATILFWMMRMYNCSFGQIRYGNFFEHEEDYRWPILRKQMSPFAFFVLNLTFIASYQVSKAFTYNRFARFPFRVYHIAVMVHCDLNLSYWFCCFAICPLLDRCFPEYTVVSSGHSSLRRNGQSSDQGDCTRWNVSLVLPQISSNS